MHQQEQRDVTTWCIPELAVRTSVELTSTGPITKQWKCFILITGMNVFHLFFQWLQSRIGH